VWVAVALGGALGTIARYEMALAEPTTSGHFPWATFIANMVGSLVLGIVVAVFADPLASGVGRPFLAVGVCGGLTTFSTWTVETVLLVRDGCTGLALLDVVASLLLGFLAVAIGVFATRAVLGRHGPIVFDPVEDD
jgi:CrcB protein